jgi:hypothetical protein
MLQGESPEAAQGGPLGQLVLSIACARPLLAVKSASAPTAPGLRAEMARIDQDAAADDRDQDRERPEENDLELARSGHYPTVQLSSTGINGALACWISSLSLLLADLHRQLKGTSKNSELREFVRV